MAYYAAQIANRFIHKGTEDGITVDPLKVQKLVYFAHGWFLAFTKGPLIRESVEAWKYGPVVPELYRQFREFKYGSIKRDAPFPNGAVAPNEYVRGLLNQVWERYGRISGIELSAMLHEPGYAWDLTRRANEDQLWGSPRIPNELIRDEFERRLARG